MTRMTLAVLSLAACLVPVTIAKKCTYDCDWADEELTLCDDRFKYIFSGKVVRVYGGEYKGFTDYDVEMTEIFRGDERDVYIGYVTTLRTKHTTRICPIRTMLEGQTFYFAVGPQKPDKNYRIFADTCNSYIKSGYEFTGTVLADLLNGKFKEPCYG